MKITIDINKISNYPGNIYSGLSNEIIVDDNFIRDYKVYLEFGAIHFNYTTLLIQLISKADRDNLVKLSKIYPNECLVIWLYQNIPDFYKKLL